MVHQNQQQQDYEEQQRQLQEEEYNRSIASPGGRSAGSRMSKHQLVQRRLERRRQERRLRTSELQSQTTTQTTPITSQPIHQPPPPPPPGTSPRSIMKKSSSYQTIPDQQYFHDQQRQPQHTNMTSSNYSSDSSANYISPPVLSRKQPFPDGQPSHPNQNNPHVLTQNGVVIDRTAFRPNRNRLRLPHESPYDEWSRNNGSPVNPNRVQQGQYQQHPQIYVPDTPSHDSASYDRQSQMRGNNRQPNWQELDQQRLMYQKQTATRHRGHKGQQNVSYVSDEEDTRNDGRVNASFNSQTKTPMMKQNRSRSLSRERQLPRRWRHNRAAASVGRGGMSQASVNTPLTMEDGPQFQYTPRSRLAVSESLGQSEVNTPMSSHSLGVKSNPLQNGRHGWRQQNSQHQQNQHRPPPESDHGWGRQDRQSQPEWMMHDEHARQQNLVSPSRSEASYYSDRDQETASVASIRKSWEGRVHQHTNGGQAEQQRGRTRDASYDRRRNTGEKTFGLWEERDNRVSQSRQGEQRREQKRNIENKWKRNASLPPPERRRGGLRQEDYTDADGYQSDGGHRSQPGRVDVEAAHVSIHDARQRLWDQDERLRVVLPQTESFDSIGDVRNRMPIPSIGLASPGNVSALSTGSALFKSKFVHAAAMATQSRDIPVDGGHQHTFQYPSETEEARHKRELPVDGGHQNRFHYPSKTEEEPPKGSSQITDSTADTTTPSSNHTSHGEKSRGSQFTKQPAQPAAAMPSIAEARPIAEASQASVADLIARINAVSRDNPAEALARIDSIIKGESTSNVKPRQQNSGVSSLFNFDAAKKQEVSNKRRIKENVANDPTLAPHDGMRFAFDDDDHEHDDPSIDDSLLSSGESTVSSMTNPTYQPERVTSQKKSSRNHTVSERNAPSPQVVTTKIKGVEYQMSVNKEESRSYRGGDDGPLTKAKLQSFDSVNWASAAPQSDFFNEYGGFRNASNQAVASSRTMQSKKKSSASHEQKAPERPATPDLMNAVSSAFSDVNISFGDNTGATQDLLAKAFSDVGEKNKARNQNVLANAFSDVDISMEQKTVRQRRKELELLSKSMTGASEDTGNLNQNNSSAFDAFEWDREEQQKTHPKQKKRIEPTLRLKSNKKLTQKFANLVKAFEHF